MEQLKEASDGRALVSVWARAWLAARGRCGAVPVVRAWFAMSLEQRKELQRQVAGGVNSSRFLDWKEVAERWAE